MPPQETPRAAPLTHQAVYEQYAQDPNAHPALLRHMGRLAKNEQAEGQSPVDEIVQLIEQFDWQAEFAEEQLIDKVEATDWEQLSDGDVDKVFATLEAYNIAPGRAPFDNVYFVSRTLVDKLPPERLHELYRNPGEKTDTAFRQSLQRPLAETHTLSEERYRLEALDKIYEAGGGFVFVPRGQDPGVDELRDHSFSNFASIIIDKIVAEPAETPEEAYDSAQKLFELAYLALSEMNVPDNLAHDLLVANEARLVLLDCEIKGEVFPEVNAGGLKLMLEAVRQATTSLTPERMQRLHDKLGVVNFNRYTSKDLATMEKLLDGDKEMIAHLQRGDVTACFVDAWGDYNGAFTYLLDMYRKTSGRTLLFEISSPGDFYRRMDMMKKRGIKPSTLVIGGHGSPGLIAFGSNERRFNLVGTEHAVDPLVNVKQFALNRSAISRVFSDEYMQDSRAIDDPPEDQGHRRLILHSCLSDAVTSWGDPSTAEAAIRRIGRPNNAVVYGSRESFYGRWTSAGVQFLTDLTDPRTSAAMRLDMMRPTAAGMQAVTHTWVDKIPVKPPLKEEGI